MKNDMIFVICDGKCMFLCRTIFSSRNKCFTHISTSFSNVGTEIMELPVLLCKTLVSLERILGSISNISMGLLGVSAVANLAEPHHGGQPKRQIKNGNNEELLMLVARGYLGMAAKQRAVESVVFNTYEIHSGDPAVAAAKEVGKKNHEFVKAARAQNKVYRTPHPLNILQFISFCERFYWKS